MATREVNDKDKARSSKTSGVKPRVPSTEEDVHVYGYGPYQGLVLVFSVVSFFMAVIHTQSLTIMASPVTHWCKPPDEYASLSADEWKNTSIPKNVDGQLSSCTRYEPPMLTIADNRTEVSCDRWDYDREVGASIIIEFDLVCERKWLLRALQGVYIGGGALLLPVMGSLADSYGRRLVLGLMLFGLIVSVMVTSMVKTLLEFGLLQHLTSASVTTFEAISTVMLFEVTPQDHRMLLCSINVGVPLVLGPLTLGLIGRFFVHWAAMQLVMVSPTLLLLLTFYLTDESPRWLMASWKFKEAEQVIIRVAYVNGLQDLEKVRFEFTKIKGEVVSRQGFGAKPNVFGIIKSTTMRTRSVILFGSWFVVFYCYLSISQYRSVRGDAITFHTMIGTANLFTLTTNYFVLKGYGRRKPMSVYMLVLSIMMTFLATLILREMHLAFAGFVLPTVFMAEVTFATLFVFTVELFPTAGRSAGVCGAFFFGRIGGVASSLLNGFELLVPPKDTAVPIFIGAVGLLALGLLCLRLPETVVVSGINDVQQLQEATTEGKWELRSPVTRTHKRAGAPRH